MCDGDVCFDQERFPCRPVLPVRVRFSYWAAVATYRIWLEQSVGSGIFFFFSCNR